MKKILLLSLLSILCFKNIAQFKQIATSNFFEEPRAGQSQIILMSDGSIALVQVTLRSGINIRIYDPEHNEKAFEKIEPSYGKIEYGFIEGIFGMDDKIVIFISELKLTNRIPVLYRLIIDSKNGKLIKEEQIAELPKISRSVWLHPKTYKPPQPHIYIKDDPNSANYVIVLFDETGSRTAKTVDIIIFGDKHQELAKKHFEAQGEFKYLEYIDMSFAGPENVFIVINGFEKENVLNKNGETSLLHFDKATSSVSSILLGIPEDEIQKAATIRYNPTTKQIIIASKTVPEEENGRHYYIVFGDALSGKFRKPMEMYFPASISEKVKTLYGKKREFFGEPVGMTLNSDETFSVVYEEFYNQQNDNGTGHTVVTTFNNDGKIQSNYFIPKVFRILWPGEYKEGGELFTQYKELVYINRPGKSYVLLNDIAENTERMKNNKDPRIITAVSNCDAYYHTLSGSNPYPGREYLLKPPENDSEYAIAAFGASAYDSKNDILIVLQLKIEGKERKSNIVWLKPQ